ncbi:hypothetical protein O1611_g7539 [Lasiodiplodia mahajangana]|uniref:Uncharacterized protein n=1 Tax=Lasiodiplodia mahajangana TaxID=1108764 RepID=A0ACC2JFG9_9PEZI|nr:hypothetical protein O1611_g7539 [Lasiodiplodia mahajangana]
MASNNQEYSVDSEIVHFFGQTSATRSECDALAKQLVGGNVVPVAVQGVCSYTVYAGQNSEFVAQFRLESLSLNLETTTLARKVYGSLTPEVSFHGQIGEEADANGKEPLYVYIMTRIPGISHLDFILSHNVPENSPEWFTWRKSLLTDMARFFALSWKHPQIVSAVYLDGFRSKCERELRLLLGSLPARFHPIVERSLDSIPAIFSLPAVLLHRDFGTCNIIVNDESCHLTGVIDWGEAEIGPFGLNLHSLQQFTGKFHLKNGWIRYDDYDILQDTFWAMFSKEVGRLSDDVIKAIHSARIMGLLLSQN